MVCTVQLYDIPYSRAVGKIQSATYPTLLKIKYSSIANHLNKTSLLTPARVHPEKRAICKFGQSNWLGFE
ncbi:hypothetical protein L873DRAFT_1808184 [Choiromyces venosus 120613-1]|uniref:Uncharacterized protein n=1 Tax=Choiromyces venosus 120613-1 TaxID=1336337 RepID=A0A3N4JJU9_9PEZI|nr:hypothetical protein L873DRAFT_1808184 [Choiromyces venosus 120613-1]